jgi:hypothetical protein
LVSDPSGPGWPHDLGAQVQLAEAVGDDGVLEQSFVGGLLDHSVEQLAQADLQEEPQAGALVHQRGERDLPAVADTPEHVLVRDAGAVEEELVELGLAGDLAQRADLHALLLHVHQEVGEPLVLGRLGVRARDEHAPLRVLRGARPHLLAGEHPLVAIAHGARLQAGEVRAGVGLGESLTPDLISGQDWGQIALLLLLGAPRHDRWTGEQQAEHVGRQGSAGAPELLEEDRRLGQRRPAPAVLAWPVHCRPAALGQPSLEVAPPRIPAVFVAVWLLARVVRHEPRAQLVAERGLLLTECQVHGCTPPRCGRLARPPDVLDRAGYLLGGVVS